MKSNKNSNQTKGVIFAIICGAIIIGLCVVIAVGLGKNKSRDYGEFNLPQNKYQNVGNTPTNENVSIVEGKQIINLYAKGGYSPRITLAKADLPTILRVDTSGTFDCSSSIRIPSMNISQNLPMTGQTDIDLGIQKDRVLNGTCGMGMYPFEIRFEK